MDPLFRPWQAETKKLLLPNTRCGVRYEVSPHFHSMIQVFHTPLRFYRRG